MTSDTEENPLTWLNHQLPQNPRDYDHRDGSHLFRLLFYIRKDDLKEMKY